MFYVYHGEKEQQVWAEACMGVVYKNLVSLLNRTGAFYRVILIIIFYFVNNSITNKTTGMAKVMLCLFVCS